jgi:TonB family protein
MFASQFEQEDREFRNRKTAISAFLTLLIHGLLLLLLLFTILHTPVPPFEDNDGGMTVNYGTDNAGAGDLQPFTYNPGPTAAQSTAAAAPAKTESEPESAITQDNEETDVVMHKENDKPKPKPKVNRKAIYKPSPKTSNSESTATNSTPVAAPVPQPKADPNAMFSKGAYGKPNGSKSDGTGGGNGDPNSRNYLGGDGGGNGGGNGALKGGYSLRGRKKLSLPPPNQCNTQGRVVVAIKVDKTGKVVDATFKRFESTVFDDCNKTNALNAARKATFNADPSAPDIQEGTITYIYEVH